MSLLLYLFFTKAKKRFRIILAKSGAFPRNMPLRV